GRLAEVGFGLRVAGSDVESADESVVSSTVVRQVDAESSVVVVVAVHTSDHNGFVGIDAGIQVVNSGAVDRGLVEPATEAEAREEISAYVDTEGRGGIAGGNGVLVEVGVDIEDEQAESGVDAEAGLVKFEGIVRISTEVEAEVAPVGAHGAVVRFEDRKSTRLNSSHVKTSYAVFCL